MNLKNALGQGLTEYIILVFLIAVTSIAIVKSFGTELRGEIDQAKREIKRNLTLDGN